VGAMECHRAKLEESGGRTLLQLYSVKLGTPKAFLTLRLRFCTCAFPILLEHKPLNLISCMIRTCTHSFNCNVYGSMNRAGMIPLINP